MGSLVKALSKLDGGFLTPRACSSIPATAGCHRLLVAGLAEGTMSVGAGAVPLLSLALGLSTNADFAPRVSPPLRVNNAGAMELLWLSTKIGAQREDR